MDLSVALAVFNEEDNIARCLDSVKGLADEVVIVDGGSSDRTVEIAQGYQATIIRTNNPPIFHINKQKALEACHGHWILQLDADETVPQDLAVEIQSIIKGGGSSDINGYYIPRHNYFWGHNMKKGGQYPDYLIRLIRRGKAEFPCRSVHEQIKITGKTGYLTQALNHYAYRTISDYWKKANAYIALTAAEMKKDRLEINLSTFLSYMFIKPIWTFMLIYFRHKGILDGWPGLVFAYFSALHHPKAYFKFIETRNLT